jgi:hypothetical protein
MYIYTLYLTSDLDKSVWSTSRPGRFNPGPGTQPKSRSGRLRETSPSPGFDPRTFQPVASRYIDWAIAVHSTRTKSYWKCVRERSNNNAWTVTGRLQLKCNRKGRLYSINPHSRSQNRIVVYRPVYLFLNPAIALSDPGPHYPDFTIRNLDLTTGNSHKTDIHAPRQDSNPQSQQASGRRPTPSTARPLGPALLCIAQRIRFPSWTNELT